MGHEIITGLTGVFCAALSSVITFLITRKKYDAEVDSQRIKNLEDSFKLYKQMTEESANLQNQTIEKLTSKVQDLQKENDFLKQQLSELQMQMCTYLGSSSKPKKGKK